MRAGRISFRGGIADLVEAAQGKVWTVTMPVGGAKPAGDMAVISTLHLGSSVQYRVVSEMPPSGEAQLVAPTLEDSYVWLMRDLRVPVSV